MKSYDASHVDTWHKTSTISPDIYNNIIADRKLTHVTFTATCNSMFGHITPTSV